jgi:NodT family efflux transporter outer membrane factor (OMF) lipoprotein
VAALTLALALGACATPERPRTDVARAQPLPPAFYTAPAQGLAPEDWWARRLQDPELARLVEAALRGSPDLAAAAARIEQARAGLRASQAERQPLLNGSGSVTYNRTAREQLGFQVPEGGQQQGPQIETDRLLYRAGVEGSWDADLFGRLAADQRAAAQRLSAAGFDAAAVRLTLITDVGRNYFAARSAAAREAIAQDNVASARSTLSVAATRARAGLVPGIDRIRAQALVAETEAQLAPLAGERSARVAALAQLTGLTPADIAPLVASALPPRPIDTPAAGIPSDLLLRRPDIAAALARVAAADEDTAAAIAARYPRLSITATLGLVASALTRLLTGDALGIVAGPQIGAPIFDGGRSRARVELARAATQEAVAGYRSAVLRAFGEVETSLAAVEARRRQRTALARQLGAAREALEVARIQYRTGLTDFLGVLEAERSFNRVRDLIATVDGETADAEVALFRALGGDYIGLSQRASAP